MVTVTDVGKAKAIIMNDKGETRRVPIDRFAFDPQVGDKCEIVKGRNGSMLHKADPEPEDDDYAYDDDPYGDNPYGDDSYNDNYDDTYDDEYDNVPQRRPGRRRQQSQRRGRTRQEQEDYDDYAGVNDDGRYANAPRDGQGAPGGNARFDDVTHLYTAASGGEKTVVCPRCSTVYDKSMRNCPVCGAKKGRKGIAAFIIFAWVLAILVVGVLGAVMVPKFMSMAQKAQDSHNALTELTENSNVSRKNTNVSGNENDENANDEYDNENGDSNEIANTAMSGNSNGTVYGDSDYSNGNSASNGTIYGDDSSSSSSYTDTTGNSSSSESRYSDDSVHATISNQ